MLVQFTVGNYLSFDGEVTLSMVASQDNNHPHHVVHDGLVDGGAVLRAAAVYGANAAGKSNLIRAVRFAQDCILHGTRPGVGIPVKPFRLRNDADTPPASKFQFVICIEGRFYDYGFVVDRHRVHEEWLFASQPGASAVDYPLFERTTSTDGSTKVDFGELLTGKNRKLQQRLEFLAEGTRPNQLFLTETFERRIVQVQPIWRWFTKVLLVLSAEARLPTLAHVAHLDARFTQFLCKFIRAAGTGIVDISTRVELLDFDRHFPLSTEEERQHLLQGIAELGNDGLLIARSNAGEQHIVARGQDGIGNVIVLQMLHEGTDSKHVPFSLDEESDGTQRLVHLLPALFQHQNSSESVIFLDELDRRLHPNLSRLFVQTALGASQSRRNQLIFSTHDTNLLDVKLLRRDEIWFVEKDRCGASHLYSLAEFKLPPDLSVERGYLNGRFGGIPFIGSLQELGWAPQPARADGAEPVSA